MTSSPRHSPRLAALQHRDFRLLWFGQLVSIIGTQMQNTAVHWQVFELLKDKTLDVTLFGATSQLGAPALGLGLLGLTRIVPIAIFALIGGSVADSRDRRKIFLATQIVATVLAFFLAALTLSGGETLFSIYAIIAVMSASVAFGNPARQALIPNLVPREHLPNAVSLGTTAMNVGQVLGPALAGLAIGTLGVGWVYAVNGVSFVGVIIALAVMRYRHNPSPAAPRPGPAAILEGVRFVRRSPMIWSTMLLDFFATFFSSAQTMLPIVANDILGVGVQGYGVLSTAQAVGSVTTGVVLSLRRGMGRQGMVLLVSVGAYGLATALFGISTSFALSYVLFALTGAADTVSTVIRNLIRQLTTPDHLRGRMVGVNMLFFLGGPQLGELEAGVVAAVLGVPFAIVSGGVATVVLTAWVALKYPKLREYDGRAAAYDPPTGEHLAPVPGASNAAGAQ